MTPAIPQLETWLAANWFSLLQTVSIVTGIAVVAIQQRQGRRQRESDSLVKLYDINRELACFAIAHPPLLKVLEDENIPNHLAQKRYLQMWLNQLSLSHSFLKNSVVQPELQEELRRNLADFMTMENMRGHWQCYGSFYPTSFQKYVNDILLKLEPPVAAQVKPAKH
jgi:hypothetical protein